VLAAQGANVWLAHLSAPDMTSHLLFVLDNTLDSQLHARCFDLLVALVWCEQQKNQQGRDEEHKQQPLPGDMAGTAEAPAASEASTALGPAATTLLRKGLVPMLAGVLEAGVAKYEGGGDGAEQASHISPTSVDAALRMLELLSSYPRPWPPPLVQALAACPGLLHTVVKLLECEPGLEVGGTWLTQSLLWNYSRNYSPCHTF
jgi:hypothetical protein